MSVMIHFNPRFSYATSNGPQSMIVADINDDNWLDIIVANGPSNNIGVFLNTANKTFINQTTYSTGSSPSTPSPARGIEFGDMKSQQWLTSI